MDPPVVLLSTLKVYGAVPPLAVNDPEPSVPVHKALLDEVMFSNSLGKFNKTVYGTTLTFPFTSVTINDGL